MTSPFANQPRLFISYSKEDRPFIEKIAEHLRRCQIYTWIDKDDIRLGKSWQRMIFDGGIANCDAMMVYISATAMKSEMVDKEMDGGLIRQLDDETVAFIPCVSDEAFIARLRLDIRSKQCLTLNESNYASEFPRLVAEIWQSFLERQIPLAINGEKVKRLESEARLMELVLTVEQTPFTQAEEIDFQFIWKRLTELEVIDAHKIEYEQGKDESKDSQILEVAKFELRHSDFMMRNMREGYPPESGAHSISWRAQQILQVEEGVGALPPGLIRTWKFSDEWRSIEPRFEKWWERIFTYGLVEVFHTPSEYQVRTSYSYSEKARRLKYWVEFKNLEVRERVFKRLN